jgi:hypothetical protein
MYSFISLEMDLRESQCTSTYHLAVLACSPAKMSDKCPYSPLLPVTWYLVLELVTHACLCHDPLYIMRSPEKKFQLLSGKRKGLVSSPTDKMAPH